MILRMRVSTAFCTLSGNDARAVTVTSTPPSRVSGTSSADVMTRPRPSVMMTLFQSRKRRRIARVTRTWNSKP